METIETKENNEFKMPKSQSENRPRRIHEHKEIRTRPDVKLKSPKAQRVGVFVDVQNMFYSARFMYNAKVNFKAVLEAAVKGRTLIRAIAYVIKTEEVAREAFYDALTNIGYEVKGKDLQIFAGGAKKGDWDVGIAMDAIELAPKLDTVVLVSGDGDFQPLVEHLKRAMGCRVEVVAFGRSASKLIKDVCDEFTDLDQNARKYLIKSAR
ncbi:MAG: NYN domain-containing protein [Candidatus Woesearchaeota archaeon]